MNTDAIIDLIMRVLRALGLVKPDTPTPTVPPAVPPVPPTVPPPAPRAVTKDDDFRTLPTISKARMCEILRGYPMEQECGAIWEVMAGNPLPLAQSWLESNYGQSAHSQRNRNPLGLLHNLTTPNHPYEELVVNGARIRLLTFNTWRDAFKEWRRRMDDPNYSGGVYSQGASLEKYLCTYLAGPRCLSHNECGNGETQESCRRYLDETVARLNRYYGVTPTSPPPPPPSTGTITFGRVPKPKNYEERFIAPDGVNTAFNRVNQRIPRGFVLHRMIGTLTGTDSYFRNEARNSALTDFGLGKGRVFRWTKPGAAISPWASGASSTAHSVASGDGVEFVEAYGWRQNSDCESIEIEGLEYDDPVLAEDYTRLVELLAWRADAWTRIPWNVWPKNNEGKHALFWHNEFQDEKPCPGEVVMELTDQLIKDVAARLMHYQEGGS